MNDARDNFKEILSAYIDKNNNKGLANVTKELEVRFEFDFDVPEILEKINFLQLYTVEKEISIVEYHNKEDYDGKRKVIYEYPEKKVIEQTKVNILSSKFNIQGFQFKISYSHEIDEKIELLVVPKKIRRRERYIIKNFINDKYELHLTRVNGSTGEVENSIEIEYSIDKIKSTDDLLEPIKFLFDMLYVKSAELLRNSEMIAITNEFNDILADMKQTLTRNDEKNISNGELISYEDKPVALKIDHIQKVKTNNYLVTNKLNGTRYYLYLKNDIFYLVGRTGSRFTKKNKIYTFVWKIFKTKTPTNYKIILDGEYFDISKKDNIVVYHAFDILQYTYAGKKEKLYKYQYATRYFTYLQKFQKLLFDNTPVQTKDVKYGNNTYEIITIMKSKFKELWDYKNDGLIFTPVNSVYGVDNSLPTLKWKFDHHQSVDVVVKKYKKGAEMDIKTNSESDLLIIEEEVEEIKNVPEKKIRRFFNVDENIDPKKFRFTNESMYSITPWKEADLITKEIIKRLNISPEEIVITDATSNVGGNTISFYKNNIGRVNSVEVDRLTCDCLKNNLRVFGYTTKNVYCDSYLDIYMQLKLNQDCVFFDPPWGGPSYKDEENLSLFLAKIDIKYLIRNLLDYDKAKLIVVKVPGNYNFDDLESYLYAYSIHTEPIYRGDEISYYILYIENNNVKDFLYDSFIKDDRGLRKFKDYALYSQDKLNEGSVIEVSFDTSTNMFYKLRSRPDKMNPNYKIAANDFWNDINNPIPITALSKIKLNLENSSQEWTGFRDYSKKSKKELIEKNIEKSSIVIDVGFGKGGDLEKYMSHGIKNIIGVEPDNKNIDEFLYRNRNRCKPVGKIDNSIIYNVVINKQSTEVIIINESASNASIVPIIKKYLEDKQDRIITATMFFSLTYFFGPDDSFANLINNIMEFNPAKILGTVMDGEKTKNFINKYEWNEDVCGLILRLTGDNVIYIKMRESATVQGHTEFLTDFSRLSSFLSYYKYNIESQNFFSYDRGNNNLLTYFSPLYYSFVFKNSAKPDNSLNSLIKNIVRYNDNLSIRLDSSYFYNTLIKQKEYYDYDFINNQILNGIFKHELVFYEKIDKNKEDILTIDGVRYYNLTGKVNKFFILTYEVPMNDTIKNNIFYKLPGSFKITNIINDYYFNKEQNDAYEIARILKSSISKIKECSIIEYNIGVGNYTIMFFLMSFKNIICIDDILMNIEMSKHNIGVYNKGQLNLKENSYVIKNISLKFINKSLEDNITNTVNNVESGTKNILFVNYTVNRYNQPSLKELKEIKNVEIIVIVSENSLFNITDYFNNFKFFKLVNSYVYVIEKDIIIDEPMITYADFEEEGDEEESEGDEEEGEEESEGEEGQESEEEEEGEEESEENTKSLIGGAEESKENNLEEEAITFSKGDHVLFIRDDPKLLDAYDRDILVGKIVNNKPDMFGRYDVKIKDTNFQPLSIYWKDLKLISEYQYENPEAFSDYDMYKRKKIEPKTTPNFENVDIDVLLTEIQKS